VNEAINKTRQLAHGLLPVASDAHGLMSALKRWAAEVEDLFHISGRLCANGPVLIHDANVSTHLYRIAQEAVNNAIRHGQAKNIEISLSARQGYGTLRIENDGSSLPQNAPTARHGYANHELSSAHDRWIVEGRDRRQFRSYRHLSISASGRQN